MEKRRMFEGVGVADVILGVLTLVFGGGGIAALIKARADKRKGIREDSRADVDSLNARAIAISQAQFDLLVTPLKTEVVELKSEVKNLRAEVDAQKDKYWDAVTYIRAVLLWISRHFPDRTDFPQPSANLAEDIY